MINSISNQGMNISEMLKMVQKRFKSVDSNQNNAISKEEVLKTLSSVQSQVGTTDSISSEQVETIFNQLDTDKNGEISQSEYLATIGALSLFNINNVQEPKQDDLASIMIEKMMERFNQDDLDKNGSVSKEELKEQFAQIGKDPAEVEKIFEEFDTNQDGEISSEEFQAMIKQRMTMMEAKKPMSGLAEMMRPEKEKHHFMNLIGDVLSNSTTSESISSMLEDYLSKIQESETTSEKESLLAEAINYLKLEVERNVIA